MTSTVVHVALAGLLGTALLADAFDARAILIVMAVTVVPDLDTFVGLVVPGAHRAALHNLLFPGLLAALLVYDLGIRERSYLRGRWGAYGVRVAWVSVVALAVAGIGVDLFFNGANLFYPVHDRFYDFSGKLTLSNQRGIVQTMIETASTEGTTRNTHYSTGVDPTPGKEPKNVERTFPIATTGFEFLVSLAGYLVVGVRLWEERRKA